MNEKKKTYMLLEIPQGEKNKYEYDYESGKLILTRTSPLEFPLNYGFVFSQQEEEKTLCEDGDELDVLCLGRKAIPNSLIPVRIIGVLKMTDNNEEDNKLLAVNDADENFNLIKDLKDVNPIIIKQIVFFFEEYKNKKGKEKTINILGWGNHEEGEKVLNESKQLYKKFQHLIKQNIEKKKLTETIKKQKK